MRVLIGSPVRQEPAILALFLEALAGLRLDGIEPTWLFVDDNDDPVSSRLLEGWRPPAGEAHVHRPRTPSATPYVRDEEAHRWCPELWWRVGDLKDHILDQALRHGFDACLLVDSDLVLRADTLLWLLRAQKDIVAEVFWTVWQPGDPSLPNVWAQGVYELFPRQPGEELSEDEMVERASAWLGRLLQPGIYPVGGLGACTLISRRAIEAGVSYRPIPNLTYWGEDRHFCVRAQALGFDLWADTHCPPEHLYRPSDAERAGCRAGRVV